MTDIVERLKRQVMSYENPAQTNAERREAVAEIERLRVNNEVRKLEVVRLRAALEEYACLGLEKCPQPKLEDGSCLAELCGDVAYRALK